MGLFSDLFGDKKKRYEKRRTEKTYNKALKHFPEAKKDEKVDYVVIEKKPKPVGKDVFKDIPKPLNFSCAIATHSVVRDFWHGGSATATFSRSDPTTRKNDYDY